MEERKINKKLEDSFEASITVSEPISFPYFREWLSTFNTESATACFTAVQELKKRTEEGKK
jgi:hypothetical protein